MPEGHGVAWQRRPTLGIGFWASGSGAFGKGVDMAVDATLGNGLWAS